MSAFFDHQRHESNPRLNRRGKAVERQHRPVVERLEDHVLLATIIVSSTNPTGVAFGAGLTQADTSRALSTTSLTPTPTPAPTLPPTPTQAPVTIESFAASSDDPKQGDSIDLSVTLHSPAGVPTGSIAFRDGARVLKTVPLDNNGRATYTTVPGFALHTYNVLYPGNGDFAAVAGGRIHIHTPTGVPTPVPTPTPAPPTPTPPTPTPPTPTPPTPTPTPTPPPTPLVTVSNLRIQTQKLGKGKGTSKFLEVGFSGALDTSTVTSLDGMRLVAAGKDKKFGTKDDVSLLQGSVTYDTTAHSLSLRLKNIAFKPPLQFSIPNGTIHDTSGQALDGNRDGAPGGSFIVAFSGAGITIQRTSA
jgi:hypothetical protein